MVKLIMLIARETNTGTITIIQNLYLMLTHLAVTW